ncbi:MAG TPA: hypothetical protein VJN96_09230 [Vicinamibacterales bacterium]|nr:hypothetical protein [Vicinamibacterales bacterium]
MSEWTDRVKNHAIWQHLAALGSATDRAAGHEAIDEVSLAALDRIRTVLSFVGKRLASADPVLLSHGALEAIAGALRDAAAQLDAFLANGNVQHVANAALRCDDALPMAGSLPLAISVDEWTSVLQAATAYRVGLEEHLRSSLEKGHLAVSAVETEASGVQARLAELATEIGNERTRLTAMTTEFQGQFSSVQEERAREFREAEKARQDKASALVEEYGKKLADQDLESSRHRDALKLSHEADLATLRQQYVAGGEALIEELRQQQQRVEKLVGVVGNLSLTSGYLTNANYARKVAWFWQVTTLLAFSAVITFAYFAFLHVMQGEFSWPHFAGRLALTLTAGAFVAYSAAQGDRFVESERRNRKLALELEALGPFLAPLPDEMRQKFRLELGDRMFGRDDASLSRRVDRSPATAIDVLLKNKEFMKFLEDLLKASRASG